METILSKEPYMLMAELHLAKLRQMLGILLLVLQRNLVFKLPILRQLKLMLIALYQQLLLGSRLRH